MFLSYWVFIFQLPSFQDFPPVAFYQGWLSLNLIRWVFNAEKPDAFPQEKTDTSYPRASLGSCPWQLLLTQLQLGRSGALLVFCFPTRLSKPHTSVHRAEFVFLSKTSLPLPLKGEGLDIACLGFVGFVLLVHSSPTRLQQGLSGASLVSFPYPVPKTAHRAARGRVWFWPAGWRLSGGLSSLSAIPCKKSSRRKNTSALLFKNRTS